MALSPLVMLVIGAVVWQARVLAKAYAAQRTTAGNSTVDSAPSGGWTQRWLALFRTIVTPALRVDSAAPRIGLFTRRASVRYSLFVPRLAFIFFSLHFSFFFDGTNS